MSDVIYLGTTDDVTTCDCCGRAELKSTVALRIDGGEPVHFGVTCAARALSRSAKEVRSESRKADRAAEKARQIAADRARFEELAPWFAFLAAHGEGDNHFSQIESLGGYKAARELFANQDNGKVTRS